MPIPKTIPLKDAFVKYSEDTQFSRSKCIGTFHRFLETDVIRTFAIFHADYFCIPSKHWILKIKELKRMLDLPFPAQMAFSDISSLVAEDIRILIHAALNKLPMPSTLTSLGGIAEQMETSRPRGADEQYVLRSLFEFAATLISLSGAEGEIAVDVSSLRVAIKRARKKKGGRPSSPAPDGMYEAVIKRIVEGSNYPGKEVIKKIMKGFFEQMGEVEPYIYRPNNKPPMEYGESYFEERATAITDILKASGTKMVKADGVQPSATAFRTREQKQGDARDAPQLPGSPGEIAD